MKRGFLGTSALIAVGTLCSPPAGARIELGLGGYMNSYFSVAAIEVGANDPRDFNPTGLFSDGEVHFTGEYEADNGILFGAVIELEMFGDVNSFGNTIDEKYAYLEATFGQVVAGLTNSAPYAMAYFAPYAGFPINSGWVTAFIPPNPDSQVLFEHVSVSTFIDIAGDNNSITYFTPRLWGFQVGLTYIPSLNANGDGKNFPVEADSETEYHNGFAVGLNYVEEFDGLSVALSGGWYFAAIDATRSAEGVGNYQAVMAGINLSYGGFTFGGSYANEIHGLVSQDLTATTEGQSFDIGASYAVGPWTFAVTYFHSSTEDLLDDPDDDTMQAIQGGFYYALGPDITLSGGVLWGQWNAESGYTNSGVAGALGLVFAF